MADLESSWSWYWKGQENLIGEIGAASCFLLLEWRMWRNSKIPIFVISFILSCIKRRKRFVCSQILRLLDCVTYRGWCFSWMWLWESVLPVTDVVDMVWIESWYIPRTYDKAGICSSIEEYRDFSRLLYCTFKNLKVESYEKINVNEPISQSNHTNGSRVSPQ